MNIGLNIISHVLLVSFMAVSAPVAFKAANDLKLGSQTVEQSTETTKKIELSCGRCQSVCGCKQEQKDEAFEVESSDGAKAHQSEIQ